MVVLCIFVVGLVVYLKFYCELYVYVFVLFVLVLVVWIVVLFSFCFLVGCFRNLNID